MVALLNSRRFPMAPIRFRRSDGSLVEVKRVCVTGEDPTSTGTIHRQICRTIYYTLATGENVEVHEDGTALVSETGEVLSPV